MALIELNDTQVYLIKEFSKDRIIPCIEEIFDKCADRQSLEDCYYLILKGKMLIERKSYSDILTDYFPASPENQWLRERLINLSNLFQPKMDHHLFLKPILDSRYCNATSNQEFEVWKKGCRGLATDKYAQNINQVLQDYDRDMYIKVLAKISELEQKAPKEGGFQVKSVGVETDPPRSFTK